MPRTAQDEMIQRCRMLVNKYGVNAILVTTPQVSRELDFADLPHNVCELGRGTLPVDEFDAMSVIKRLGGKL